MFAQVASFELRHQLRQPVYWVVTTLFLLLAYASTASENFITGLAPNDYKNGPYAIAVLSFNAAVFFMFVNTAVVAGVIVRDEETGFGPIIRTTQLGKFDYLIGRFLGAVAAAAIAFMAVPLGILIGSMMPWLDPEAVGPFRIGSYLFGYGVLGLPTLLMTSAAFFALATLTRNMMATYLCVVVFLALWLVAFYWARQVQLDRTAALFDPFGAGAFRLATRYWTTAERNTLIPPLTGLLLLNRALVLALAAALLALTYALFRLEDRARPRPGGAGQSLPGRAEAPTVRTGPRPRLLPSFGLRTHMAQLFARTRLDMTQVFLSPGFRVLLGIAAALSVANMWRPDQLALYGTAIHPVTRVIILQLGNFNFICLVIATYYAGDLVWRERDRRTHEIVESTPVPNWAFVIPKTAALTLVLIATLAAGMLTGMGFQIARGWYDFGLDKYVLWFLLPGAVDMFMVAALAVFLQAASPNKVVGWALMVLYVVAIVVLPSLGLEHHLYLYATAPYNSTFPPLSDMNGWGRFWVGGVWLRLYWSAGAVILLVLAYGLWRRGLDTRLLPRLRRLPARLGGGAWATGLAALAVFVCSGVWIYINTNVWNPYRSQLDQDRWLADYEKALLPFESMPQPKIVQAALDVDIRPSVPRVTTHGIYEIENRTAGPLREIHVRFPRDLVLTSLSIQGARPKTTYDQFNYRIFAFDTPMLPGEKRHMAFETVLAQRGFRNERDLVTVLANGTFLEDRDIAPVLGMDRRGLLQDRRKRAKYGLRRELRMIPLGTPGADAFNEGGRDADWVGARIRVSTDADQVAVAPGYQELERVLGGRRTVELRTEAPIQRFFSIQSARYAVRRETYKGVGLAVLYHPTHGWNVERMLTAARASLDYYQANFSPYQFRQLRFVEFPATRGRFASSFANTVPWSEDLGFIAEPPRDSSQIDFVTYVGAHEVSHQWWAHQLIGADEQGATVLTETLAQYSALMVMKRMYGEDMIRRFLKYELDRYLRARGGDPLPEQPLMRVEDQPYIHYRKGSLVMYRLQDEIGEAAVNRALRRLLERYAFKGPPYPTSLDLVAALRAEAPADKQALITDLFERITLYDLKTTRASAKRRPDRRWDISLTVSAKKLYADGRGQEREAPMSESLDVGLFSAEPGKAGFDASKVVSLRRLPIRAGTQTLHLVSDRRPVFVGVDPYDKLIDRNADDNIIRVGG